MTSYVGFRELVLEELLIGTHFVTILNIVKKKLEHLSGDIKNYLSIDDFTICDPAPLTNSDTKDIESVCDTILSYVSDSKTKLPVTSQNINNNLDKFKIINMPKLGKSLHDYIKNTKLSTKELIFLNNIIIKFISVVIPSMNRAGVIHGDLKSANILFSYNIQVPVIIDWGLSYLVPSGEAVPDYLKKYRFRLFEYYFLKMCSKIMKTFWPILKNKENSSTKSRCGYLQPRSIQILKTSIIRYINIWQVYLSMPIKRISCE